MTTRVLAFTHPASVAAARHLLASPPLSWSPFAAVRTLPGGGLSVRVDDGRLSSGEADCLVPLLAALSTEGAFFDLRSLWLLDEDTRRVAWEAVGIGAGCIAEVLR